MQRCDGSLLEWMAAARTQPQPLPAFLELVRNIALGLQYVHGCDIVHGDVKPSNVLLREGVPLWTDFEYRCARVSNACFPPFVMQHVFDSLPLGHAAGRSSRRP
mgnify:CR=1 FL=1